MITGKHEALLEKAIEKIEHLLKGSIYHAEDINPNLTKTETDNHTDNMYLHGKAAKAVIDNFINDL